MFNVLNKLKISVYKVQYAIYNSDLMSGIVNEVRMQILAYCFSKAMQAFKDEKFLKEVIEPELKRAHEILAPPPPTQEKYIPVQSKDDEPSFLDLEEDEKMYEEDSVNDEDDDSYSYFCNHCKEYTFYSQEHIMQNDGELDLKEVCLTDTCIEKALKDWIAEHLAGTHVYIQEKSY